MSESENIVIWAENLKIGNWPENFIIIIKGNEIVGITGLNTEDKQELLKIFGCIKKPNNGRYIFDYEDTSLLEIKRLESIRRNKIGYVFNSPRLLNDLNVIKNVTLWLDYIYPRKKAYEMGMNILKEIGMKDKRHYKIDQLSNLEKVLVSLGSALINKPLLLLVDDVYTYLRPDEIVEVNNLFRKYAHNGTTIIILADAVNNLSIVDRIVNL